VILVHVVILYQEVLVLRVLIMNFLFLVMFVMLVHQIQSLFLEHVNVQPVHQELVEVLLHQLSVNHVQLDLIQLQDYVFHVLWEHLLLELEQQNANDVHVVMKM
jgi:hypothetical protein